MNIIYVISYVISHGWNMTFEVFKIFLVRVAVVLAREKFRKRFDITPLSPSGFCVIYFSEIAVLVAFRQVITNTTSNYKYKNKK